MRAALVAAALWCFLQIPLLLWQISLEQLGSTINPHLFPSNSMAQIYSRDGLFVNALLIWVHVALCRCVNGFLYVLVWAVRVRRTVHRNRTGSMKCMTGLCVRVFLMSLCKTFHFSFVRANWAAELQKQPVFKVVMRCVTCSLGTKKRSQTLIEFCTCAVKGYSCPTNSKKIWHRMNTLICCPHIRYHLQRCARN